MWALQTCEGIVGHELLVETGLRVQLHFLFSFEREISASLSKELRKQDLPLDMWLLASLCSSQYSSHTVFCPGSLPQSRGSVIGIPESEMQVPNDSVLVTSWPRAGTLQ